MANIVCVTSGLRGVVNASFEVVSRLQAAGHRVIYCCPEDVSALVQMQGFTYEQLPPINFQPAPRMPEMQGSPLARIGVLLKRLRLAKENKRVALSALNLERFTEILKEYQVDLVLADIECPDHIIEALIRGVKVMVLSSFYSMSHRKGIPHLMSNAIPGQGKEGSSLRILVKKWHYWLKWTLMVERNKLMSMQTDRRSILIGYARANKLDLKKYIYSQHYWPGPFLFKSIPTLNMTAKELDFPHALRKDEYCVGPMVHEKRVDPVPADFENTLNLIKNGDGQHTVYCALSSFRATDQSFIKRILAVATRLKEVNFILGLGDRNDPEALGGVPENVLLMRMAPAISILPYVDAAIITPGINMINECIHFKVPMLVFSLNMNDQNGNAARVAFHEVGLRGEMLSDGPETIQARLHEVLTESRFRENINSMRQAIDRYREDQVLERLVASHLNR